MPKPKKAQNRNRPQFVVYLNREERELLTQAAEKTTRGKVGTFIREAALERAKRDLAISELVLVSGSGGGKK